MYCRNFIHALNQRYVKTGCKLLFTWQSNIVLENPDMSGISFEILSQPSHTALLHDNSVELWIAAAQSIVLHAHGHGQAILCQNTISRTMLPLYLLTYTFCNRKKIKHSVTLDLALFQIQCTFTWKNQKGKFFELHRKKWLIIHQDYRTQTVLHWL